MGVEGKNEHGFIHYAHRRSVHVRLKKEKEDAGGGRRL